MIFLAVVNGQPREMGLVPALQPFIDHRVDVIRRRTAFLLQKAKDRAHILEGYQKALDHLDHVIAIIRGSESGRSPREPGGLLRREEDHDQPYGTSCRRRIPENPFSTKQADAILELQLHRLTRLSIDEIVNELNGNARAHRRIRTDSGLREEAALGHRRRARSRSGKITATSAARSLWTKPRNSNWKT